jgi:hypothetical protein
MPVNIHTVMQTQFGAVTEKHTQPADSDSNSDSSGLDEHCDRRQLSMQHHICGRDLMARR